MKKTLAFLLTLLLMFQVILPAANALDMAEIDSEVDKIFSRYKTVGSSVVVMKDGDIVYERDYGLRNITKKLPVDENTYFKMGCVTKMVSSLAILQLVDDGTLDLDADISQYFGYDIINPYFPKTPITLRQLLSHTSTVSETGGYTRIRNTVKDILYDKSRGTGNYTKFEPGSKYKYSNFGSGLVGSIVEAVSGQSVNRFVTERLFEPLNMDASLAASWLQSPDHIASLYTGRKLHRAATKYIAEGYEDTASPETHFRTMVGALFIRSRDLAKIVHGLSTDGSVDGVQFLKPETVQLMREEQHLLGKSVTGKSPYGLFLERNTLVLPGHTVYGHQGMTGVSSNNVYFEPESGFVFVVTTNGSSQARDHGTMLLAQTMLRYTYSQFSGAEQ